MKPVIGVPLRYRKLDDDRAIVYISERLRRTLQKAGSFVYPIAPVQDVDYIHTKGDEFEALTDKEKLDINYSLDVCDGVLFSGGIKFTPYDRYLLELCIEKNIPVLGICLGMQMMSCYNEEITLEKIESSINHDQKEDFGFSHKVKISKDSKLYSILGKEELVVNSFHKMHATENNIYKTVAISEDGFVEGIEYPSNSFNIGIQWHPEISYDFDEDSKKIIDTFIEAASIRNKDRNKDRQLNIEVI